MCQTHESYNSQISVTNRYNPDIQVVSDKLLIKIKDIKKKVENVTVYNIETAEDHSYTVNNVIVHNCTYWSIAQKNNRETEASGMGWELFSQYVRALRDIKPKYFIYENNKSMSKAIRQSITETFGFDAVCINSALVSAQNRQRLYWVGKRNDDGTYSKINIEQPKDRGIILKDILDGTVAWQKKSYAYTTRCQGAIPEDTLSKDIPYFAINVPNDTCNNCGFTSNIDEICPVCGSNNIARLRRVTGYLTGDYKSAFNNGKKQEVEMRVTHSEESLKWLK